VCGGGGRGGAYREAVLYFGDLDIMDSGYAPYARMRACVRLDAVEGLYAVEGQDVVEDLDVSRGPAAVGSRYASSALYAPYVPCLLACLLAHSSVDGYPARRVR
jgi:hypothetical protein